MRKLSSAFLCAILMATLVGEASGQRFGLLKRLKDARGGGGAQTEGVVQVPLPFSGLDRHYQLLDAHRGPAPAPLIILLHGGGGNGGTMIARWATQARLAGLIVAAPDGIGRRDKMGTWNAGGCCGEAAARGVDDIGFVRAVIDDVAKRTAIDPTRLYVAGFSNGGMLTHRVAAALGNRIAAAAVVSGALFGNEARPAAPVPMLVIHGEKDDVVAFKGGTSPTSFVARAQTLPFLPVRQSVDYWRQADGCAAAPVVTRQPNIVIERSTSCRQGSDVVFYDLPRGGHEWSGPSKPGGAGTRGDAVDTTDVIWRFFERHHR